MILAIETATSACSVALIDGDRVIASTHEVVGRGHAERLIPMIADLPGGGRADHIVVGCGPGSFTGIRVGIAAARALALGWGGAVHGYSTLALIAAQGFEALPNAQQLSVTIEGGHGEIFVETYARSPFAVIQSLQSLGLEDAARVATLSVIGNAAARIATLRGAKVPLDITPVAANVWRLPSELRLLAPTPVYGRAPDAKPMSAT